jgi:hypothetical protein
MNKSIGWTVGILLWKSSGTRGDANGFLAAWTAYCDHTGKKDDGFRKGHVNKERKTPKKKKRNFNEKW